MNGEPRIVLAHDDRRGVIELEVIPVRQQVWQVAIHNRVPQALVSVHSICVEFFGIACGEDVDVEDLGLQLCR
jgi:hypothetical protein